MRRSLRVGSLILVVVLLVLAIVADFWYRSQDVDWTSLERDYTTINNEFSSHTFERVRNPPGWSLTPGPSAPHYLTLGTRYRERTADDDSDSTVAFDALFRGRAPSPDREPSSPMPLPETCRALGVRDDGTLTGLDASTCGRLQTIMPLVDPLIAASRYQNTRTPFDLLTSSSLEVSAPAFAIELTHDALLVSYLRDHSAGDGRWTRTLEVAFATIRMGRDITRGAWFVHAMFGLAIERAAQDVIRHLLLHETMAPEALDTIIEQGRYITQQPILARASLLGEYLYAVTTSLGGCQVPFATLPTMPSNDESPTMRECKRQVTQVGHANALMLALLDRVDKPLPEALEAITLENTPDGDDVATVEGLQQSWHRVWTAMASTDTHLRLLILAAAARKQRAVSSEPVNLETLLAQAGVTATPEALIDPLTHSPFALNVTDDTLMITSRVLGEPRVSRHLNDPTRRRITLTWSTLKE